jgi:two-component system LytT family response regulator
MKIRTVIVDDEPLARERLKELLLADPEIEVVGECPDGYKAIAAIQEQKPDLVLLDVQMPEISGFGVLDALPSEILGRVIFVTAYDQYALKAFEVHAVDYLLKPIYQDRLQKALQHFKDQLQRSGSAELSQRLSALLADHNARTRRHRRLVIRESGAVLLLQTDDIDWLEATGDYVLLHLGKRSHMIRETMNRMEARLDPNQFLRIHRSTIVNIDRIRRLHLISKGEYEVVLRDDTRLAVSRSYRNGIQRLLADSV